MSTKMMMMMITMKQCDQIKIFERNKTKENQNESFLYFIHTLFLMLQIFFLQYVFAPVKLFTHNKTYRKQYRILVYYQYCLLS